MRRHEIDAVSLAAGLLFLIVAVVHIVARSTETDLNLRWMVPAVLVLLGVLGMLSAVRFPRREPAVDAAAAGNLDEPEHVEEAEEASPQS